VTPLDITSYILYHSNQILNKLNIHDCIHLLFYEKLLRTIWLKKWRVGEINVYNEVLSFSFMW